MAQNPTNITFETAFESVKTLVANFDKHKDVYLHADYAEAAARTDFIDKFFQLLGWDVAHDTQKDPLRQEVKVERNVTVGARQKRADYAFYVSPNFRDVRLYCEAKKPSIQLDVSDNYFQTVRYGWNGSTPIAALTSFHELHILDCRYKPNIDTILECGIKEYRFRYTDYSDKEQFAKIYFLLSRESVAAGRLEELAGVLPKRRGKSVQRGLLPGRYQPVDEEFLAELDEYREMLARSFKHNNPSLDGPALTEITQRTLDRLVFFRFLEDKLIETKEHVANFGNHGSVWGDFVAASKQMDAVYNGAVFKEHDLLDTGRLVVDDAVFGDICEHLSHTNTPYDFNAIPIHILGSIYERFLGKIIVVSANKAKVEDKPEVRKAGGVYYTPERVVRYIVDATVGRLIADKTPQQIAKMRFADIACGSGSFLLGVYDCLLRYHHAWYNTNPGKAKKDETIVHDDGSIHLSLAKRRNILLNNIYGVDLDPQAVEVAQLSLYLKLLEEETTATARNYQLEFGETLLPSLNRNVLCGNALVEHDILQGHTTIDETVRRLNPFEFTSVFADVFKNGGFDAVVGNPPFLFITELGDIEKDYYFKRYGTADYRFDVYGLFIERSLNSLLRDGGYLGYITPRTLLGNDSFEKLRRLMLSKSSVREVVDIGPGVFKEASNETMVFVVERGGKPNPSIRISLTNAKLFPAAERQFDVNQSEWAKNPSAAWQLKVGGDGAEALKQMETAPLRLGQLCAINQGLRTGDNEKYIKPAPASGKWKPVVGGKHVGRYEPLWPEGFVYYDQNVLDAPRRQEIFESPEKIVVQEIRNITLPRRIVATYDDKQIYCLQSTNVINRKATCILPLKFLLAFVNSDAVNWYFRMRFTGNNHIASNQLAQIPIPDIQDPKIVGRIENLITQLLSAHNGLSKSMTDSDKSFYQNLCASLDTQVNGLVNELYGLADKHIKEIEIN